MVSSVNNSIIAENSKDSFSFKLLNTQCLTTAKLIEIEENMTEKDIFLLTETHIRTKKKLLELTQDI